MQYSKELKESILRRILLPNSEQIAKVAKESVLVDLRSRKIISRVQLHMRREPA